MGFKHSGLQREALSLYRSLCRAIRAKPVEAQPQMKAYVRQEYERHRHVSPKNFLLVEHLLRQGRKQMAMLQAEDVTGLQLK